MRNGEFSDDLRFSVSEVNDGFNDLKNCALGLDGVSKTIIEPILIAIAPTVASFFAALLCYSVSPSDWQIAVLCLINNFRAVHLLSFFYKWFTSCIRRRILPFVSDRLPPQQRGFIAEGSCAQALLALLTVIQRETRGGGLVVTCFVDIRKAFPSVRRELLFYQMHKIGIPNIYIRCLMALYTNVQGSARAPAGFSPTFPILQGTREGCILSPLLFLIFFSDAMAALERVHLGEGTIRLGAISLLAVFFRR